MGLCTSGAGRNGPSYERGALRRPPRRSYESSIRETTPVGEFRLRFRPGPVTALCSTSRRHPTMTSQGTAHGHFQRAIHAGHLQNAETAAPEMGGLSLADALPHVPLLSVFQAATRA